MKQVSRLLAEFASRKPIRTGSLIISVFGDAVSPHSSAVWLGSLIKVLEPFGLNQRQIRTAVFRLVQEDWLVARQMGRRSYYSFTGAGQRHYEKAARRIYHAKRELWGRKWTLVLPTSCDNREKDLLRRELSGRLRRLTPGMLGHPSVTANRLMKPAGLKLRNTVVVLIASTEDVASREVLRKLCQDCWGLAGIEKRYNHFIQRYGTIYRALRKAKQRDDEQCFQVRTLLIHEYRRILLQDSDLPEELLPPNWPGASAYNLTKNIYHAVQQGSVDYLMRNMETVEGGLDGPGRSFYSRFDGAAV